jgi:two-component system invasion response regulator UvrY
MQASSVITLLIADDHAIIRRGLKFLLEMHFRQMTIFETESNRGVLEILEKHPVTHLILDMHLQDANAIEIFSNIRSKYPQLHILVYTMSTEEIFGKRMLQFGADGFLNKQSSEPEVIRALEIFLRGKKYVSESLQDQLDMEQVNKGAPHNPFLQLSERETEVLIYLLKGSSVKDIAEHLDLKSNTVATFKARLFDKIGVSNLIDLQNMARMYHFQTG